LASGALITAGGSAAAVVTTVVQAHPAGACGWQIPAGDATHHYDHVPLSDSGGNHLGDITLFYEPCSRDVKGMVTTGTFGACDGNTCVGSAQVIRPNVGQTAHCSIPAGGTYCQTDHVYDGGIQQYAKGQLTIGGPGFTDTFVGTTSTF
jgi:hypothetical protein